MSRIQPSFRCGKLTGRRGKGKGPAYSAAAAAQYDRTWAIAATCSPTVPGPRLEERWGRATVEVRVLAPLGTLPGASQVGPHEPKRRSVFHDALPPSLPWQLCYRKTGQPQVQLEQQSRGKKGGGNLPSGYTGRERGRKKKKRLFSKIALTHRSGL